MQRQWREKAKEVDGVVDEEVIAEVVSKMTGVPLTRLEKEEAQRSARARKRTAQARRFAGRSDQGDQQDHPPCAFGPERSESSDGIASCSSARAGVGKTLLSKALAEFMFGDADALIQIDMSEYMEKHNVSRLIGAPPGYVGYEEGGQLTERIRRRPYSVVLLDEVEKAHPDVFNMLLQIMEEGRLTDSFGRHVDFRNVVMIMTSNIGARSDQRRRPTVWPATPKAKGRESEERTYQAIKTTLMKEIERYFRPEFIGRLDDVIVFRPLSRQDLERVVEFEVRKVTKRLTDHGLKLDLSAESKEFLIDKGTSTDFGARPLRRAIEQNIEDPLAEEILRGNFKGKDLIRITVKTEENGDKHLFFEALKSDATDQHELAQASSDAT